MSFWKKFKNYSAIKQFWIILALGMLLIILAVTIVWFATADRREAARQQRLETQTQNWDESVSYDDGCNKNKECSKCKRELECLDCMHACYNRNGDASNRANPLRMKAISCHSDCWEKDYGIVPKIDFGIAPIKKK